MNAQAVWPAPAKLNLYLRVTGRRADGYHLLDTLFQFLDYGDELVFRPTADRRITRLGEVPGVPPAADLTLQAARLLQQSAAVREGVEIGLRKRLPVGGGLGGGSSDAATTLLALNRLWRAGLSVHELAVLGLKLGADVPVFVRGRAAQATGVGEALVPVELPEPWYVVVVPPVQVSTAAVFAAYDRESRLTPLTAPRTIRGLRDGVGGNDLEFVVRRDYPAVERAFRFLAEHAAPRLTGAGASVFAEVADAAQGREILEQLPETFGGFVARGMNRHPLAQDRAP